MKFIKILIIYLFSVLGIAFLGIVPRVIMVKGLFNITGYIEEFIDIMPKFFNPGNWIMTYKGSSFPIVEFIKEPYLYSISIIAGAFLSGLLLALLFTWFTFLLPSFVRDSINKFFTVIPALLAALLIGFGVVHLIGSIGIEPAGRNLYLAPILTLSIIPAFVIFGIFLSLGHKKETAPLQSRGLSKFILLFKSIVIHNFAAIVPKTKAIISGTIVGLFAVESLFSSKGLTLYMAATLSPVVIAVFLLFIFTPFFILYQGTSIWLGKSGLDQRKGISTDEEGLKKNLANILGTIKIHFANPKFTIGFTFLFGLLIFSICYSVFKEVPIKKVLLLTDGHGKLISSSPHPPSSQMWFGSDMGGRSIRDQLLVGAKYTLTFGLVIALLRVAAGFFLAIHYTFHLKENTRLFINKVVDSIHFLPLSLIAVVLLVPILTDRGGGNFEYTFLERIVLEVVILTLLVIPLTTVLIGNEMRLISQQVFVESARTLGGDNRHILWKHIFPHLASRLFIIFGQQFIQVLLIFVHLGLFRLFFGGTIVSDSYIPDPPRSSTYEWSGIISDARDAFAYGKYWLVIPALIAFMLCIVSMQLIVQGVKEVQQRKVGVLLPKRQKHKKGSRETITIEKNKSFSLLSDRKNKVDVSG